MQSETLVLTPLPNSLPTFTPEQAHVFSAILTRFLEAQEKDGLAGIEAQLAIELPKSNAKVIREEIENELKIYEEKKQSLEKALENGRTKEQWLASEIHKATKNMAVQEVTPYLNRLDEAIKQANYEMQSVLLTNEGVISQNPNLDGFIAEQQHAQQFNLNAAARGSEYRAEVLKSDDGYAKNSVDVVIKDAEGKVVKRYQSKYGQDAQSTKELFEKGDYRGQQKLVPSDQKAQLEEQRLKVTDKLEAPDGTTSKPLSKQEVKEIQEKAQKEEQIPQKDYNDYQAKDLARGIGKEAGKSALYGAGFSLGIDVVSHIFSGEKLDQQKVREITKRALTSGVDTGAKSALATTIKVAAEKGILPKALGSKNVFVAVASTVIENIKVLYQYAQGKLTGEQTIEKLNETTMSTMAGVVTATKGAEVGAAIGAIFGPVGAAVGGFIGGTLGYMAGSAVGQKIAEVSKSIVSSVVSGIKSAISAVGNAVKSVASGIKSACQAVVGWFS
ncbi:glycine zipper family protein [Helicobacter labacensis]|uniref:glycine zipper family protein n=1 Tax=Helicobacter labacensis TaxID=2316079 RepID=UPI000EB13499|nr:glycine zipper family protein [Helicobacter labacensis]